MSQIAILKDTLRGHRNWVFSVAFHPTANLLATGSKDDTAKLWSFSPDGSMATCVATLEGHGTSYPQTGVHSVAFHPTANLLATGSVDCTAKLWRFSPDGSMATCVATLEGHRSYVYSVAFHPTANLLATGGSYDNTAKLWQFSPDGSAANNMSARCVATLEGHRECVKSVAFHPTANLLATGSDDDTAKLWRFSPDGSTATCVATLEGHRTIVNSVAFHPTANLLATGSHDQTAKLWRFSPDGSAANNMSARCVATLEGGNREEMRWVYSVAFHPRANLLATGSSNGTTKLWRFSPDGSAANNMSATCVATLEEGPRYAVYSVAFHQTANLLATGSGDNTAKLWELNIQNIQNQIVPQILSSVGSSAVQHRAPNPNGPERRPVSQQIPFAFAGPSNFIERRPVSQQTPSASAGRSDLTFSENFFRGKVINIPRELRVGTKNSASNSCPSYKPLYDQLMLVNLDGKFQFSFEGERGIGPGLTKMVYSFLLPVYTKLYFVTVSDFIILKKDANIEQLLHDTQQIIKLAKAAQSQVYLQIDPRLLELLLPQNAAETIARSNNFNRLYANLRTRISQIKETGEAISNYLLLNSSNQSINSVQNINNLTREIQAEIILRNKLVDFGFETWLQYQNMANFIEIFWIASNRRNEYPLFSCEIKYDIESFMERLQIKREDTKDFLKIQEAQSLYGVYPALGPLLDYILDQSENGNENRRKLVKYVAGTEYTLCRILISLQTVEIPFKMSNKAKLYELPFLAHTCSSALDLFKNPRAKNYQEVWTPARIDEEITKGSGLSAHN
jgi:WD40 repeat protein